MLGLRIVGPGLMPLRHYGGQDVPERFPAVVFARHRSMCGVHRAISLRRRHWSHQLQRRLVALEGSPCRRWAITSCCRTVVLAIALNALLPGPVSDRSTATLPCTPGGELAVPWKLLRQLSDEVGRVGPTWPWGAGGRENSGGQPSGRKTSARRARRGRAGSAVGDRRAHDRAATTLSRLYEKVMLRWTPAVRGFAYALVQDEAGLVAGRMHRELESDPRRDLVLSRFVSSLGAPWGDDRHGCPPRPT